MADHLRDLPVRRVAAWYRRLADRMAREKVDGEPAMAPMLLRHWLDNRDNTSTLSFAPPKHLKESPYVTGVLTHHRGVFLSQLKSKQGRIVGVLPRLRGDPGFKHWDMSDPLQMNYHSLVEVGSNLVDIVRIKKIGTRAEKDLLTALRGFQLHSRVTVSGTTSRTRSRNSKTVEVRIVHWRAHVEDRYDWDYSEYFTVPNPDYKSTAADAVRPQDDDLTVYHRNAQRLERAGLAAPYNLRTHDWQVAALLPATARFDLTAGRR